MEIEYNDAWTDEQIKVAEITIGKAQAFNWLHIRAYKYYSFLSRALRTIISVLTFILSAVGVIMSNVETTPTIKIAQTVIYGVFILFSAFAIVLEIWNPGTRAAEHYNLAERNKELYQELRADLIELVTHEQIHQMLTDRLKTELHMRDEAPGIPKIIWKQYFHTFGAKALPVALLTCTDDLKIAPIRKGSKNIVTVTKAETIIQIDNIFPSSAAYVTSAPALTTPAVTTPTAAVQFTPNLHIDTAATTVAPQLVHTTATSRGALQPIRSSSEDPLRSSDSPPDTTRSRFKTSLDRYTNHIAPNAPPNTPVQQQHDAGSRKTSATSASRTPSPDDMEPVVIHDRYPARREDTPPPPSAISLRAMSLYTEYANAPLRKVDTRTEIARVYKYVDNGPVKSPRPIDVIAVITADKKTTAMEEYEAQRYINNNN